MGHHGCVKVRDNILFAVQGGSQTVANLGTARENALGRQAESKSCPVHWMMLFATRQPLASDICVRDKVWTCRGELRARRTMP